MATPVQEIFGAVVQVDRNQLVEEWDFRDKKGSLEPSLSIFIYSEVSPAVTPK